MLSQCKQQDSTKQEVPPQKAMTIRRLATASGALALACGRSPCHSFTLGPVVHLPYSGRNNVGSNGVVRPRPRWAVSAASAQDVVAATALPDGGSGGPEARSDRRWIRDVKTGDKVIGYVADTTGFAAFVDVGVVRHGSKVSSNRVKSISHENLRTTSSLERCFHAYPSGQKSPRGTGIPRHAVKHYKLHPSGYL